MGIFQIIVFNQQKGSFSFKYLICTSLNFLLSDFIIFLGKETFLTGLAQLFLQYFSYQILIQKKRNIMSKKNSFWNLKSIYEIRHTSLHTCTCWLNIRTSRYWSWISFKTVIFLIWITSPRKENLFTFLDKIC